MNKLQKVVESYYKNGALALKDLKHRNMYLYKLLSKNLDLYKGQFNIVDDTRPLRTLEDIKLFLLYYYGTTINLADIIKKHSGIYYRIYHYFGTPKKILKELGFTVIQKGGGN